MKYALYEIELFSADGFITKRDSGRLTVVLLWIRSIIFSIILDGNLIGKVYIFKLLGINVSLGLENFTL